MIAISEVVTRCALERKETRGGHTRDDYPNMDSYWESVNSVVSRNPDGSVNYQAVPKEPLPEELEKLLH